ncbi:MAG: UDP-N-acetylglucosamine--N-acetylmuramyl-(pentapeptide) pyrophosphoryl-undecaprenol N-acetylglucosamine transferase [Elusimicrobia bacterium]|nr:UDP-N-acetylglucosamine--N-acetylmuramyl-(pentapeptide) pyrophosphoryl-undecaprenol N-acetylglucosamine transferase [Elusimicrobiota bacterium]
MKRVVLAAGGTGGHFYPGLSAAKALRARGWEPLLVVRSGDPALARLEAEGIAALPVDLRGLPRRPGPELLAFARRLAGSLGLLSRALRAFSPDLALGMGGYLTFPLAYAARRRGVPLAVHESNAVLGLANRAAAFLGAELFWGLPPADPAAGGALVGTPVRPELWSRRAADDARRALGLAADRTTVLVFGGSQGARALNASLPRALKPLGPAVQVLHLAGKGKAEEARAAYAAAGVAADVRDYLEDMAAAYGAADLVVCRSGASTLAELAAQRAPAVLVPYPHATAGHQDVNARVFERAGAAVRLPEGELAPRLGGVLADLLQSTRADGRRAEMARAYDRLGLPPAERTADVLADRLEALRAR